jgi:hypothetical protein
MRRQILVVGDQRTRGLVGLHADHQFFTGSSMRRHMDKEAE